MELRKVETEVNEIAKAYKSLRLKRLASSSSSDTLFNLSNLPSLEDISAHIAEKEEKKGDGENGGDDKDATMEDSAATAADPSPSAGRENTNANDKSMYTEENEVVEINTRDALAELESFRSRLSDLDSKADKFKKRMAERDPVTDAPRYGEKTMARVKTLINIYDSLIFALKIAFGEEVSKDNGESNVSEEDESSAIVHTMKRVIQDEEIDMKRKELEAFNSAEAQEARRLKEVEMAAEREKQKKIEEEEARKKEEAELARRAEEARRQRIENERRAEEEAREADRAFEASIKRGGDSVRAQIRAIRESCGEKEWNTAIGALHTIFSQIAAHPEEPKFRRIRRDHPKFNEDIGRHAGGKEVLIAAGFGLDTIEGVPSFFSKEPNIEHDMDGWSDWFNGLKETLKIIEEEMIK